RSAITSSRWRKAEPKTRAIRKDSASLVTMRRPEPRRSVASSVVGSMMVIHGNGPKSFALQRTGGIAKWRTPRSSAKVRKAANWPDSLGLGGAFDVDSTVLATPVPGVVDTFAAN